MPSMILPFVHVLKTMANCVCCQSWSLFFSVYHNKIVVITCNCDGVCHPGFCLLPMFGAPMKSLSICSICCFKVKELILLPWSRILIGSHWRFIARDHLTSLPMRFGEESYMKPKAPLTSIGQHFPPVEHSWVEQPMVVKYFVCAMPGYQVPWNRAA